MIYTVTYWLLSIHRSHPMAFLGSLKPKENESSWSYQRPHPSESITPTEVQTFPTTDPC
ncbi:hypothetical protein NIES39_D01100 [Arthrospira platensis NIES-39]|nr:hypothetical protein NIES39_D01100 [Arthrospira platensis NIES-39]